MYIVHVLYIQYIRTGQVKSKLIDTFVIESYNFTYRPLLVSAYLTRHLQQTHLAVSRTDRMLAYLWWVGHRVPHPQQGPVVVQEAESLHCQTDH